MEEQALFEFSPYHVLMVAAGAAIFLAHWLPRLLSLRAASSSALLMVLGFAAHAVPGMPEFDPTVSPKLWELTSEIVLIVVLFSTGLRIDKVRDYRRWRPTIRLLAVAMPATILVVATLGWSVAGMTLAGAVLLGAALAPTDPVLAGDVQVGPPLEGREHPVRFALTSEAGLNDGLAFPFVYLGLWIASGAQPSEWLSVWVFRDLIYRIAVGVIVGAAVGWLLGKTLFHAPGAKDLARTGTGVVALAAVLLCYGVVELAEGYGFIGSFVAGLACRRVEDQHEFHRRLHAFSEPIELAVTAILLVLLGSALPGLWPALDWRHALIGLSLLLLVRPLLGWLALARTDLRGRDRALVGFFGVRGVGSIYYLSYAAAHIEFVNEEELWALVGFTIFASAVIHGATGVLVERATEVEVRE